MVIFDARSARKAGIRDSETSELYKGFFYRDKTHKVIQHFNHQAREHLYLLALEAALETQPSNAENKLGYKRSKCTATI